MAVRTGSVNHTDGQRFCQAGLIHLAELHCQGLAPDHPLFARLVSLLCQVTPKNLDLPVTNWFSANVGDRLALATLYVLLLVSAKQVVSASYLFRTVLPAHKTLLERPEVAGLDPVCVGRLTRTVVDQLGACSRRSLQEEANRGGTKMMHPEIETMIKQFL